MVLNSDHIIRFKAPRISPVCPLSSWEVGRLASVHATKPLPSLGYDQIAGNLEHPVLTISSLGWCPNLPPSGIRHFFVAVY